jgi:hypothetical protein
MIGPAATNGPSPGALEQLLRARDLIPVIGAEDISYTGKSKAA